MGDFNFVEALEARRLLSASLATLAALPGGPCSVLIADRSGNLYGTTTAGGPTHNGTIFRLSAATNARWTLATFNGSDGSNPSGGLVADAAGNLYGTTQYGGAFDDGTIFELSAGSNRLITLASFSGADGDLPCGKLVIDPAGNLYGATESGGVAGGGTVFKLTSPAHNLTTLVSLDPSTGDTPQSGLLIDPAGNLYGTTNQRGAQNFGVIYKIQAGTTQLTKLYSFTFGRGYLSNSALIEDAAGNLYGTSAGGWSSVGQWGGSILFKLSAGTKTFTTAADFPSDDMLTASAGLFMDGSGNIFGTTRLGGLENQGSIYELSPSTGKMTTVFSFTGNAAEQPDTGLIADSAGNLYGTAQSPTGNNALVYKITSAGSVPRGIALVSPGNQSIRTGYYAALGYFNPTGLSGPYTVTVNWGDGSAPARFTQTSIGQIDPQGYTYHFAGPYTVKVSVADVNTGIAAQISFQLIFIANLFD